MSRVQGLGSMVWGSVSRVQGLGSKESRPATRGLPDSELMQIEDDKRGIWGFYPPHKSKVSSVRVMVISAVEYISQPLPRINCACCT